MIKYTLKQLELFITVAECNSFTEAAERHYMSQSTVSTHVAALESALGVPLVVRYNRKRIFLTEAGQLVYKMAKDLLTQCSAMEAALARQDADKLLIGASSVPAQCMMPQIMANFDSNAHHSAFVLKKGDSAVVHDLLRAGEIRIGLVGTASNRSEMNYTALKDDALVLIAPNQERFRVLQSQHVPGNALFTEPMVVREPSSGSRQEFRQYLKRLKNAPKKWNIVAEIDQPLTIIESVAQGVGVAVISSMAAAQAVQEGRVLSFPLEKHPHRSIYLVTRKDFSPTPAERAFIECVQSISWDS